MAIKDGLAEEYGRHSSSILPVAFLLMKTCFMIFCKDDFFMLVSMQRRIFLLLSPFTCKSFKSKIYILFGLVRQFKKKNFFFANSRTMNHSSWKESIVLSEKKIIFFEVGLVSKVNVLNFFDDWCSVVNLVVKMLKNTSDRRLILSIPSYLYWDGIDIIIINET